jgi:hypothetical protein
LGVAASTPEGFTGDEVTKLFASDAESKDLFGVSVFISGTTPL